MSDVYIYNDQMWKVDKVFEYTGVPEEFTINNGTYLFICKGASGGITTKYPNKLPQPGGTSYGIIDINEPIKMYAVVGGNGNDATNNTPGVGGYNGGGTGGTGYSTSSYAGAGGGGATDIRLSISYEDETESQFTQRSLLSRIIVAGGGGGLSVPSGDSSYRKYCGVGGGIYGGPLISPDITDSGEYATQNDGYKFGIGMDSITKTISKSYGDNGAGAGGGGWYGGFSQQTGGTYTDTCGGGGSGYVVTNESYKPDGYNDEVPDSIRFINHTMIGGSADKSEIIICKLVSQYSTGDKLIIPRTGKTEKFILSPGQYVFKCWGGDGGVRNIIESSSRGGYAQGTLTLDSVEYAYAHVGGSGIKYAAKYEEALLIDSSLAYNGGGIAGDINNVKSSFGGGATDIRIGSDSLLSRIIVAGGAGGHGSAETAGNRFGGAGGGISGNASSATKYGTTPGPGTQTGTPDDSRVGGMFGIGGNGSIGTSTGFGGAGGGGWYGGSGTYPDSGDDDRGGCGGSGYVLTESSNKPIDYLLDEKYYLTDTILTTGGNDLPIRQTKIEIDVLDASFTKIICKDEEGYKYFNDRDDMWQYLSNILPTNEQFMTYGSLKIINDNGLLDDYDIYAYNEDDNISTSMVFNVVPPELIIRTKYYTKYFMNIFNIDADIDETNVDFSIEASRAGIAEDSHIDFTVKCTMKDIPSTQTRVYCIQGYTQGSISGYYERKPKEKTIDHIDLLPIGAGNRMPSRYKSYIGGFINGTEAITTVESAVCCIHNRSVYSATLCNNKVVRIAKLDLVSNTSTVMKDILKTDIGDSTTYYGDILVDDNYVYITPALNGNSKILWRISLDPNDTTIYSYSPGSDTNYAIYANGKMEWCDDHTIVLTAKNGLLFFNTNTLKWTFKQSNPTNTLSIRDMLVGDKYIILTYESNSNNALVYDIENDEWSTLTSKFNITLANSYINVGCYVNGKFYITQRNRLYIINENNMTVDKSIITPYTNIDPTTIEHANGILYITMKNSMTLYIYDIKNDRFYSNSIPFKIDNKWTRGASFKGYFFLPNIKLFTMNFAEYAKYNIGYKYDRFIMITNKECLNNQQYEYDDRFVTFTDDSMIVHTGNIIVDMETLNENKNIKYTSMNKSQYTKIINQTILIEENNNNEKEEDNNESNESNR